MNVFISFEICLLILGKFFFDIMKGVFFGKGCLISYCGVVWSYMEKEKMWCFIIGLMVWFFFLFFVINLNFENVLEVFYVSWLNGWLFFMVWNVVFVIWYKIVEVEDICSCLCKRVFRFFMFICFIFLSGVVNRYWICFLCKSYVDFENFNLVRKCGSKCFDIVIIWIRFWILWCRFEINLSI